MFSNTFYYKTDIYRPFSDVWNFFQEVDNIARITSFPKVNVLGDRKLFEGANVHLQLNFFLVRLDWNGKITEVGDNYFIDEGKKLPFPFKTWRHSHSFEKNSDINTKMIDRIEYESCLPPFIINTFLREMFLNRKKTLLKVLQH